MSNDNRLVTLVHTGQSYAVRSIGLVWTKCSDSYYAAVTAGLWGVHVYPSISSTIIDKHNSHWVYWSSSRLNLGWGRGNYQTVMLVSCKVKLKARLHVTFSKQVSSPTPSLVHTGVTLNSEVNYPHTTPSWVGRRLVGVSEGCIQKCASGWPFYGLASIDPPHRHTITLQ